MSKIHELITQYCPDGVEYRNLELVYKFQYGTGNTIPTIGGEFQVYGSNGIVGSHNIYNSEDAPVIGHIGAYAGIVNWGRGKHFVTYNGVICKLIAEDVLVKYAYFQLLNQDFISLAHSGSQPFVSYGMLNKIAIPVPPIEVQEEIVSILDKFTALEADLEAELEARTRQYEYYRNQLLAFEDKEVEWKTLGEVGEFIRGSGLQKTDFTETGVGCIHYGQIYTYYGTSATETKSFVSEELAKKFRKAKKGDLVIAGVSENIEDICKAVVWLGEDDICISGDSSAFRHNQNPKFIGYLFQTNRFLEFKKKYVQGAKVTRLRSGSLPTFSIPVPPIEEQERIVKILDQFDALVNDISVGLPAEIQARRQQYKYYRGKLLTFEKIA